MGHLTRQARHLGLIGVLVAIWALFVPNLAVAEPSPRVLLTAYTTSPAEPTAGEEFVLTFTLQNMSSTTGVQNLKATINSADGSVLPVGGTSSVYTAWIGAGASVSYDLRFRPQPAVEEGPYQLALHVDYEEAANGLALTSDETMTVNVRQHTRVETSALEVQPTNVTVGQEASLTFSVLNKGKNKLYNTSVSVKPDQAVTAAEQFVGTIEAGTAGAVDMVLQADAASNEPVTMVISYEDAVGNVTTLERQVELIIDEPTQSAEPEPVEEVQSVGLGASVLTLVVPVLLVAALVIALVVRHRRKRAAARAQESVDALDFEPPLMPEDQE